MLTINQTEPIWQKISPEAQSFISQLICYEPDKRLSASEALHSPWIQKYNSDTKYKEADIIITLDKLRTFRTQMTFQKAVLAYIASQQLCQAEEKKLRDAFEALDTDKNGVISKDELIQGYMRVFKDHTRAKDEVDRIMRRIDINQNGALDYNGTTNKIKLNRVFDG